MSVVPFFVTTHCTVRGVAAATPLACAVERTVDEPANCPSVSSVAPVQAFVGGVAADVAPSMA